MFRKTTYIILTTLISTTAFGQSKESEDNEYVIEGDNYVLSFDSLKTKDKTHYSFETGAGFGRSSAYGNYFSTYYKPMISYDLSPRFSVNTGLSYVNSSVDNIPVVSDYGYQLFSGNISQYYAFVGGQYKLTDKLSVGGSVFYDFTSYKAVDGTALNTDSGLDNLGYSANFKYKVNENLSIQGEIRINDKNSFNQYPTFIRGFENEFIDGFMGADNRFKRRW